MEKGVAMRQVKPGRTGTPGCWGPDEIAELSASTSVCAGVALPSTDDPSFDTRLERARHELEGLITEPSTEATTIRRACRVLLRVDALQRARADARCREEQDFETFRSLCGRLGSLPVEDLLDLGASQVCSAMGFGRALFSSVSSSLWIPRALFLDPDLEHNESEVRTFVTNAAWQLEWAPLESDVVRRRSATLVECAKQSHRTFRPLMEVTQARSYVVTPVRAQRRVVGLLHADRATDGVDRDDLGRLEAYAQAFGAAIERAMINRRIQVVASRASEVLAAATAEIAHFDGDAVFLSEYETPRRPEPVSEPALYPDSGTAARLAELSPREFDVLSEMSHGLTNAEIATRLCVTEGTVKSYVKGLLRKLGVHSRAAAAAILAQHENGRSRRCAP